jgi:tRNA A37 threonylcarbamoyladenosine modification protein TsaB
VAQGWQLARNVKLLGINTVTSMAEKLAYNKLDNKYRIVIDAQRGEFYCADYDVENGSFKCAKELSIVDINTINNTKDRISIGTDIRFKNAIQLTPDAKSIYRLA